MSQSDAVTLRNASVHRLYGSASRVPSPESTATPHSKCAPWSESWWKFPGGDPGARASCLDRGLPLLPTSRPIPEHRPYHAMSDLSFSISRPLAFLIEIIRRATPRGVHAMITVRSSSRPAVIKRGSIRKTACGRRNNLCAPERLVSGSHYSWLNGTYPRRGGARYAGARARARENSRDADGPFLIG